MKYSVQNSFLNKLFKRGNKIIFLQNVYESVKESEQFFLLLQSILGCLLSCIKQKIATYSRAAFLKPWVAKACKLPRVKEKICAHKISEVKNLFKRSLQF